MKRSSTSSILALLLCTWLEQTIVHQRAYFAKGGDFYLGTFGYFTPAIDKITNKYFDVSSDPQRIVIRFTNTGPDPIQVSKILYSSTGLGLPEAAMSSSYRKEGRGSYNIPFNQSRSGILPGEELSVELYLNQIWKREDINRWAGEWGYLRIYATMGDISEEIEGFFSI